MRARFISRFDWAGKDVYCYDDLDTGEVVYLDGGRNGKELRRYRPIEYTAPRGRAVDVPPRQDVFQFIRKSYKPKEGTRMDHIHWASPED